MATLKCRIIQKCFVLPTSSKWSLTVWDFFVKWQLMCLHCSINTTHWIYNLSRVLKKKKSLLQQSVMETLLMSHCSASVPMCLSSLLLFWEHLPSGRLAGLWRYEVTFHAADDETMRKSCEFSPYVEKQQEEEEEGGWLIFPGASSCSGNVLFPLSGINWSFPSARQRGRVR